MTFGEACGKIYAEEIDIEVREEANRKEYMNQSAFRSCWDRGKCGGFAAERRVDRFKALAILLHRKGKHGEDRSQEEVELMAAMPEADIQLAAEGVTTYSWWKNE